MLSAYVASYGRVANIATCCLKHIRAVMCKMLVAIGAQHQSQRADLPASLSVSLKLDLGDFTLWRASSNTITSTPQCSHELSAWRLGGCLFCVAHTAPPPTTLPPPMTLRAVTPNPPSRPPMPHPLPPRAARTRFSRSAHRRVRNCVLRSLPTARASGAGASGPARGLWLARVSSRPLWQTRYVLEKRRCGKTILGSRNCRIMHMIEHWLTMAQPRPMAAIDLIHKQPVRWTDQKVVSCDGGGGPLGHPRVFINTDKPSIAPCGYCGLPFVRTRRLLLL